MHFVLLNGSPKTARSSSGSFGAYIIGRLTGAGVVKETFHAGRAVRKEEKWNALVRAVDDADAVLLSFPLYWDSLPSHLVAALERLKARRTEFPPKKAQTFYAIVNNGFPEPWHNEIAVAICRQFCKGAGFAWGGGINIGGGGAIDGRPLEETGGMTIRLRQTLDMAARAIASGEPLPPEVAKRLEKPMTPKWLLTVFGGFMWRSRAKKEGVKGPLDARPYDASAK